MIQNKKRGMSTIIIILLVIVLSIGVISILSYSIKKITKESFGEEVNCFDALAISPSFFIKNSCYLNSGEIAVDVERKSDILDVKNIKFAFFGDNVTRFQITGKKCSDARTINTEYGGYCEIVKQDLEINYIFNVSDLDRKNKVKLVITQSKNSKEISCLVDTRDIKESC